MPPKRKVAAKKVIGSKEAPVETIDPNEKMVDKDDDVDGKPKFTARRPFEKSAESLAVENDEKLRMFEDRMVNPTQNNTQMDDEKLPEVSTKVKSKSKKDKTDDPKEKKTRKRAISEERPTKTGEKLGVKNNKKKQEKVENEILALIEPIKRTRRANSVDRLATEIPIIVPNVQKKNQKSTKSNCEDDKQKKSKRVLKMPESIPDPIMNEKKLKSKRTTKKNLDSEENIIIPDSDKPTVKQKGLKKEKVLKKSTEDTLEIQTGTEALRISRLKKDKPAKRVVKKEIIKHTNNTDSDDNVVTSDDRSDPNSDSDVTDKVLKSVDEKGLEDNEELDENSDTGIFVDNSEEDGAKDEEDPAKDEEDPAKDEEDPAKDEEDPARDEEDAAAYAVLVQDDVVRLPLELTESDFNDDEPILVEKKPAKRVRKLKQPTEDEKVVKLPRSRKNKVNSFEDDVLPDISSPEDKNIEPKGNPKKRKTKAKAKK